jgi:16S rRNA (guanine1516-N2)-methyltransferase
VSGAPVAVDLDSFQARAEGLELCARTGLPPAGPGTEAAFLLRRRAGRLVLERVGGDRGSLVADFLSEEFLRRLLTTTPAQPLARAVGLPRLRPEVLDATAGLCTDALVLAALGCSVTAVERSPALFALADDALARARRIGCSRVPALAAGAGRLTLALGGSRAWLEQPHRFDVVYLDPMYPTRAKAALGKLELRIVAEVAGEEHGDEAARQLAVRALHAARLRVVVKRPLRAPPLLPDPDHTHRGKMARYDVHLAHRQKDGPTPVPSS